MGVTTLQVNLNTERMLELSQIKKARKIPLNKGAAGFLSDDAFAKVLLMERMDEQLKKAQ